jgi:hypothetical protein
MMISWIHFTPSHFVRQAGVGLGDLREEHLSHAGEDPSGSRPSSFRHTPQGSCRAPMRLVARNFKHAASPRRRRHLSAAPALG